MQHGIDQMHHAVSRPDIEPFDIKLECFNPSRCKSGVPFDSSVRAHVEFFGDRENRRRQDIASQLSKTFAQQRCSETVEDALHRFARL